MANKLYESFMGTPSRQQSRPNQNANNPMQNLQKLGEFMRTFNGNPKEQVMQLLTSGQVSQEQYDQAAQMANMIRSFF